MDADSFAAYAAQIRTGRGLTLRGMAAQLGISPSYYNDVEKGRRNPLPLEKLEAFARITGMTATEKNRMYDLAGLANGQVAPDLAAYIIPRQEVAAALRTARDCQAAKEEWEQFAAMLRQKREQGPA